MYNRIKDSLVNANNKSIEKFSFVKDIIELLTNFNINLNILLQGDENDIQIINKVCIYLMDIFLDKDTDEFEEKNDNQNEVNAKEDDFINNEIAERHKQ